MRRLNRVSRQQNGKAELINKKKKSVCKRIDKSGGGGGGKGKGDK